MLHHEPWRDELSAWMLSRDSPSLAELMHNRRYDGHPPLWHLLMFPMARVIPGPGGMQLLHLAICGTTAYLIARWSPLPRWDKAALLGGVFFLYEYGVISRGYALGNLGLVCFAVSYLAGRRRQPWLWVALMAQTSAHAFLVAASMAVFLALQRNYRNLPMMLICGLSFVTSAWLTLPPKDTGYAVGWTTSLDPPRLCRAFALVWQAYVPIPLAQMQFYDTNILNGWDVRWVAGLGLGLMMGTTLWLRQTRIRLLYLGSTLLLVTFAYVKFIGFSRHSGHLYLVLLVCLWLDRPDGQCNLGRRLALRAILWAHLLAGAWALGCDWKYPFSAGLQAAQVLQAEHLDRLPMVGLPDSIVAPIACWLRRPIWYADCHRSGTFVIWDNHRIDGLPGDLLAQVAAQGDDVVVICDRPLYLKNVPGWSFQLIREIPGGIVPSEQYFLYRATRSQAKPPT